MRFAPRAAMNRLILFSTIYLGAGCGQPTIDGPIEYKQGGGLTGSVTLKLHIDLDGLATRPTSGGGTEHAMLDADAIAGLHHEIYGAQFWTLDPAYTACCDQMEDIVSVQL